MGRSYARRAIRSYGVRMFHVLHRKSDPFGSSDVRYENMFIESDVQGERA